MSDLLNLLTGVMFLATLGLLPAFIAHHKGRSFKAWWLYGTILLIPAVIMALVQRKGDTAPVWGRWGLVSSPRHALRNVPIFLAINLTAVAAPNDGVKVVAIGAGCVLLYAVSNHFLKQPQ